MLQGGAHWDTARRSRELEEERREGPLAGVELEHVIQVRESHIAVLELICETLLLPWLGWAVAGCLVFTDLLVFGMHRAAMLTRGPYFTVFVLALTRFLLGELSPLKDAQP